jgi:DNA-binding MarR family transcriptional regulator
MHQLFFAAKRTFHATLHLTRHVLRQMGLTAARYDLLHCIWLGGGEGMLQRELHTMLGVTKATVSRMLRALEQLRLVRRTPEPDDRRLLRVELTLPGCQCFDDAKELFEEEGAAGLAVASAVAGDRWSNLDKCWPIVEGLVEAFGLLPKAFARPVEELFPLEYDGFWQTPHGEARPRHERYAPMSPLIVLRRAPCD